MKPPIYYMIISQGIYLSMVIGFALLAYGFYTVRDGRLRKLLILLFSSLAWKSLIEGGYYFIWDIRDISDWPIQVRIISTLPVMASVVMLVAFILKKKGWTLH